MRFGYRVPLFYAAIILPATRSTLCFLGANYPSVLPIAWVLKSLSLHEGLGWQDQWKVKAVVCCPNKKACLNKTSDLMVK